MHLMLKMLGINTLCKHGDVSLQRAVTSAWGQEKVSHVQGTADERSFSAKTLTPCTALFYFPGSSAWKS